MAMPSKRIPPPAPDRGGPFDAARARAARVTEVWRVAMAHLRLGEMPIAQLDLYDPVSAGNEGTSSTAPHRAAPAAPAAPAEAPSEDEIDEFVAESFPASDPPSWTKSHA